MGAYRLSFRLGCCFDFAIATSVFSTGAPKPKGSDISGRNLLLRMSRVCLVGMTLRASEDDVDTSLGGDLLMGAA